MLISYLKKLESICEMGLLGRLEWKILVELWLVQIVRVLERVTNDSEEALL